MGIGLRVINSSFSRKTKEDRNEFRDDTHVLSRATGIYEILVETKVIHRKYNKNMPMFWHISYTWKTKLAIFSLVCLSTNLNSIYFEKKLKVMLSKVGQFRVIHKGRWPIFPILRPPSLPLSFFIAFGFITLKSRRRFWNLKSKTTSAVFKTRYLFLSPFISEETSFMDGPLAKLIVLPWRPNRPNKNKLICLSILKIIQNRLSTCGISKFNVGKYLVHRTAD